jgi:tryptophan synthase beta subunit
MLHCVLQVDPEFKAELRRLRREFIGGPTPIYHARHAPGDL